jgi:hypothetical protein
LSALLFECSRGRGARFKCVEETDAALLIRDLGPWDKHPSVTNDAENVVAALLPFLYGRRLFYFDSEGDLGELVIRDGKFAAFKPADQVPR